MQRKTKQLFFNFMVLFFTICLLIIVAEIAARIISRELAENNWVGAEKKYYEYDPLLGWKKIPKLNTTRASAGNAPISYQINSRSIRGHEYSYEKLDNEYRVLILGDSFAEGFMVEFHELFSEVLKDRLSKMRKNRHYQTINTGTSGWSTDQELLLFQNEGKKYKPNLTILMFYENDIAYNNQPKDWGMYYKPLFKIENGILVLTNVPVPKPDIFIIHDHLESEGSVFRKIRRWLNVNSYLYKFIKERIKNTYGFMKLSSKIGIIDKQINEKEIIPPEYRAWEKNYNETIRSAWGITEAILIKLRDETALIDSKLLVFYVPFEGSIHNEVWDKLKRVYNFSDEDWSPDRAGIVLEDICKRNNIDFINPTEKLKTKAVEVEKDNKRLYDPVDHHWNAEGNKFVGELLAEYIAFKYLGNNK